MPATQAPHEPPGRPCHVEVDVRRPVVEPLRREHPVAKRPERRLHDNRFVPEMGIGQPDAGGVAADPEGGQQDGQGNPVVDAPATPGLLRRAGRRRRNSARLGGCGHRRFARKEVGRHGGRGEQGGAMIVGFNPPCGGSSSPIVGPGGGMQLRRWGGAGGFGMSDRSPRGVRRLGRRRPAGRRANTTRRSPHDARRRHHA